AVCTGDGDSPLQTHEFRQHECTGNHWNTGCPGGKHFRIVRGHGRGNDNSAHAFDVFGAVTNQHLGPKGFQTASDGRSLQIRTTDRIAEVQQNFGDSAHAGSTYTNEVDALDSVFHFALRATCSHASAMAAVAERQACSWACTATSLKFFLSSFFSQLASQSAVSSDCLQSHAP